MAASVAAPRISQSPPEPLARVNLAVLVNLNAHGDSAGERLMIHSADTLPQAVRQLCQPDPHPVREVLFE